MKEFPLNIRNEKQLKAVLGVTPTVFNDLVASFDTYIKVEQNARYYVWMYGNGKRKPPEQPAGKLSTAPMQVAFVLYYLKNYSIMETFAERFSMSKGHASNSLKFFLQRLYEVLNDWEVLPHRSFDTPEQMQQYMEEQNWTEILIDVTERRHHRPKNETEQRAIYSGKKKPTLLKIQ